MMLYNWQFYIDDKTMFLMYANNYTNNVLQ